ncbi:hypothetical protein NDU88_005359 [Pleurodeles waltl]|uniref:Uncharacterized protein n=1 Tax=Pleurodeles waltl TaxID=8319 RepID=A0AAV7L0J1_PLEWA|nr:hypothetical protein NDU88_005359 [Pleurodeles waltl]
MQWVGKSIRMSFVLQDRPHQSMPKSKLEPASYLYRRSEPTGISPPKAHMAKNKSRRATDRQGSGWGRDTKQQHHPQEPRT